MHASSVACVQLERSRRRLELLLEDVSCDTDPLDYYETTDQLLEPLLLCYESLVLFLMPCFPSKVIHNWYLTVDFLSNHVDLGC